MELENRPARVAAKKATSKAWWASGPGRRFGFEKQLRQYGLSGLDWALMWWSQEGRCAICDSVFDLDALGACVVDHCHSTGKVRGLLCRMCNMGLGAFRDDRRALVAAVQYLSR